MDEFVRLFLSGEALQNMVAHLCDEINNKDGPYLICKKISYMCKSPLCIRMTPLGLAPFKSDITMVYLYRWMTDGQRDYLRGLLDAIHMCSLSTCNTLLREYRVQGIGLGNEVSLPFPF